MRGDSWGRAMFLSVLHGFTSYGIEQLWYALENGSNECDLQ